jgi:hypothetical protein
MVRVAPHKSDERLRPPDISDVLLPPSMSKWVMSCGTIKLIARIEVFYHVITSLFNLLNNERHQVVG